MNKKEHTLALKSALSLIVKEKRLIVVDEEMEIEPKTRLAVQLLKNLGAVGKVMIVVEDNVNLLRAVGNLQNVIAVEVHDVSVYDLLNTDFIIFEKATLKAFEGGLV
jgi:large subunit ribosomal protein L4